MTAITRSTASSKSRTTNEPQLKSDENLQLSRAKIASDGRTFSPSSTEGEAKFRFVSALKHGVDELMRNHGHGRGRASAEILRELADGSSPSEDEVRKIMSHHSVPWSRGHEQF